jgi:DNA-binding response OmpR family regulator
MDFTRTHMNTDFRIALISDDLYHLGLLKGYCQAHSYKLFETPTNFESINEVMQMQPDIIILAIYPLQEQITKLIRELSFNYQTPVCYLHSHHAPVLAEDATAWADTVLDAFSDISQLDRYLRVRFNHHRFIQEKRKQSRRTASDRRLLHDQQSTGQLTKKNGDSRYYIVEPFQIDQRSKCVLYNGKSLNLTRKEFELFELLTQDVDRVFMTDEIINHVWPENNRVTKSDLYQYMHLLRKKIENDPNNPQWILTVKGFGYKLNLPASA